MSSYLDKRDYEIDKTEWIDIYYALKAIDIKPDEKIVELCAGKGYLIEFLSKRLPYNKYVGVDLEGCKYSNKVICMDLNQKVPPEGDIYIFQHCIEHLEQDKVINLLKYCLRKGRAIIGIVPGHYSDDPTHVVNHYHYEDLLELISEVKPKYYYIRPDLMSYINPSITDYLIILSNSPIDTKKTFPRILRYGLGIYRRVFKFFIKKTIGK